VCRTFLALSPVTLLMPTRASIKLLCLVFLLIAAPAWAAPRIKVLKVSITNPTDQLRLHENIVVSVADLKRIAPDFKAGAVIVTPAMRPRSKKTRGLCKRSNCLRRPTTGRRQQIRRACVSDRLKPKQTRIVTIAYGEPATIQRLRGDYPKRTAAKFTMKFDGLAWESEANAWRIYFDKRNAIDLFGKRRPVYLEMFGAPESVYHWESPWSRYLPDRRCDRDRSGSRSGDGKSR